MSSKDFEGSKDTEGSESLDITETEAEQMFHALI